MNSKSAIANSRPRFSTRQVLLVSMLLIVTWATQIRFPPLSYPAIGLMIAIVIAGMTFLIPLGMFGGKKSAAQSAIPSHPAFLPGFLLILWLVGRWAVAGFPTTGSAEVGTFLWGACYFIIAACLTSAAPRENTRLSANPLPVFLLYGLAIAGLLCGLQAIWQYYVSYDQTYKELLASLVARPPDKTELGILYHLKLRRVASVWGDPNSLATFSAVALCASLEIFRIASSLKWINRLLASAALLACLAAIYYSGSRGGVLDALFVLFCYLVLFLAYSRKNRNGSNPLPILLIILAVGLLSLTDGRNSLAQTNTDQTTEPETLQEELPSGWAWRSNTIRERLYYLEVGEKMIRMAPLAGLGPGSVDVYFGRLKSPQARETRYLHNWIVQIWAETGLVGLVLMVWFLSAITWRIIRNQAWRLPVYRALTIIFALIILDGLIQITYNQRELVSLFGMICGILTVSNNDYYEQSRFRTLTRLLGCLSIGLIFVYFETWYLKGESEKQIAYDYMYSNDYATADEYLAKASKWIPNDPEPYAARASIALDSGKLSASQMLISKAISVAPQSASIQIQAAGIADKQKQTEKVDAHLTKALYIYPSNPEYNYKYSLYLQSSGNLTKALKFARRAVKYNYLEENKIPYDNLVSQLESQIVKQETRP